MSFKWWSVLLPLYLCSQAFASAGELRVCQQDPSKYAYRIELANLILARTAERYGELRIVARDHADPSQDRCMALLADGLVDLAYVPPSDARLRDFAVIPFDIHSGMLGYRLLLINRADAQRFAAVNSLDDLRRFTGGFGSQWSDFPLFANNSLPVVGVAQADNLLAMLNSRRFDYYHRGLHEAWQEVAAHRDIYPLLMVEPHLALAYSQPVYFTFNRTNTQLKQRFEEGLAQIRSDGSYRQLFLRHFGELVRQSRLSERRVIRLQSETPAGLPGADSDFWLQP
ncbi:substrate-binding periplasmic protein [Pseudomonas sp. BMS12]|uniref:substrate-binding periplasmic protein n=1 Tax=Pseudomonas sp. BMS12 TaxID=1796033 RepID=UPI000839FFA3|nr:transporter substrate-binding domain-containing protein [Pseudomonas sp. BMS12]